ncbi:iduronate-sulfatase domain containing protein [Nitzschia inconspicua]|uniref:Iduronate-sulfatase domain containing protein n=1 Tax=Nitzschia inconspicua TaxID=303405 RepID=A0A9K3L008_9STRA|nr:iduronate-sulfatase domain containing protein [Nitzschia inconspicua]
MARPNIIVMQPDDFEFLSEWTPPAHRPGADVWSMYLPNIDRLRTNGIHMKRAYTTSPSCGNSRYSTMTGRYPSRSSYSREINIGRGNEELGFVTIPTTKLVDVDSVNDGKDCSKSNMAVLFQSNGYATGMFGKWHLFPDNPATYSYESHRNGILKCGFDTAEAVYWHNLNDSWTNGGEFSHNTEYMTKMALDFMEKAIDNQQQFFMYFNPTAPHGSGSVWEALMNLSCLDTPAGRLSEEPIIPGMTEGIGCEAYRQTVVARANGTTSNPVLGSIWVDDAVGALLLFLESRNILNSTIFLFQEDHGQESKFSLYEGGVRIPQFVHYPDEFPAGSEYSEIVSTIDVAPTLADLAGITANSPGWYEMDGKSWRSLPHDFDRCLMIELDYDRSVICACRKLLEIASFERSNTYTLGQTYGFETGSPAWFDLCDANGSYLTPPNLSPEQTFANITDSRLTDILTCHIASTRPIGDQLYGACDSLTMKEIPAPTTELPTLPPTPPSISNSTLNPPQSSTVVTGEFVSLQDDALSSGTPLVIASGKTGWVFTTTLMLLLIRVEGFMLVRIL